MEDGKQPIQVPIQGFRLESEALSYNANHLLQTMKPIRPNKAIAAASVLLGLAVGVVFAFDPASMPFYPQCPWHALTGLNCAGCGATRALHQLLHGHVAVAAQYNVLLVLSLPALCAIFFWQAVRRLRGGAFCLPLPLLIVGLTVALTFGVLRNLPVYPFTLLNP